MPLFRLFALSAVCTFADEAPAVTSETVAAVTPELTLAETVAQLESKGRKLDSNDVFKGAVKLDEQQKVGGCLLDAAAALINDRSHKKGFLKGFRRHLATCCTQDKEACVADMDSSFGELNTLIVENNPDKNKEGVLGVVATLLAGARKRVGKDNLKKQFAAHYDKCAGDDCTWEELVPVKQPAATTTDGAATTDGVTATEGAEAKPVKEKKPVPATLKEMLEQIDAGSVENDFEVFKHVFKKASKPTEEKAQVAGCLLDKVDEIAGTKKSGKMAKWILRNLHQQLASCCTKDREACVEEVEGAYGLLAEAYADTKTTNEVLPLVAQQLLTAVRSRISEEGLKREAAQLHGRCADPEVPCTWQLLRDDEAPVGAPVDEEEPANVTKDEL